MIEMNLLVDKSEDSSAVVKNDDIAAAISSASLDSGFKTMEYGVGGQALKLLLMFGFLGGVLAYEKMKGDEGKDLLAAKYADVQTLQDILQDKEASLQGLDETRKQFSQIKKQSVEVKTVKRARLLFIMSLDALQAAVLGDLWLTKISFSGFSMTVDGTAFTKELLDSFLKKLRSDETFSNVIVIKESESISQSEQKLLDFSLRLNLTNLFADKARSAEGERESF